MNRDEIVEELFRMQDKDYAALQALSKDSARSLRDDILITTKIRLLPEGALTKREGKAGCAGIL